VDEMHQNVGKANGVAIRRVEADHSRDRDFWVHKVRNPETDVRRAAIWENKREVLTVC